MVFRAMAIKGSGGGINLVETVTSNQGPTSGTTELVIATAPVFTADGSTLIEVEFSWYNINVTDPGDFFQVRLYDGDTAGSGTELAVWTHSGIPSSTVAGGGTVRAVITPSAGDHTYTARLARTSGSGTAELSASSISPAVITVAYGGAASSGGGTSIDPAALPKLTTYAHIPPGDFATYGLTLGASDEIQVPAPWETPGEETGSVFDYSSPGVIEMSESGVYAVTITLATSGGIVDADPTMDLRYRALPSTFNAAIECSVRGGDGAGPAAGVKGVFSTASYTYYVQTDPGDDRGRIDFYLAFSNFDDFNMGTIDLTVTIQQIIPA